MLVTTSEVFRLKLIHLALEKFCHWQNFFASGVLYANTKKADLVLLVYSRWFKEIGLWETTTASFQVVRSNLQFFSSILDKFINIHILE